MTLLPPGEAFFDALARALAARPVARVASSELRASAVLVPLFLDAAGDPHAVFTRRVETLPSHAGQVSFPGGACDPDDPDELATALRETEEELAIPRGEVLALGRLDDVPVITGFRIAPFVGRIPRGFAYRPNVSEVARVFEVPLAALVDPARARFRLERMERRGKEHVVPFFEHEGEVIWGATGRIVLQLLGITHGFAPPEPPPRAPEGTP